jgi:hypothetical protein
VTCIQYEMLLVMVYLKINFQKSVLHNSASNISLCDMIFVVVGHVTFSSLIPGLPKNIPFLRLFTNNATDDNGHICILYFQNNVYFIFIAKRFF